MLIRYSLPLGFSIFSAELFALYLATLHITKSEDSSRQFLVITDSLSALKMLGNYHSPSMHPIGKQILHLLFAASHKSVTFAWAPGHKNIKGNKLADTAAKEAAHLLPAPNIPLPLTDARRLLKRSLYQRWQQEWTTLGHHHLQHIKPSIGLWKTALTSIPRRSQVVLNRIRIGHSLLTHVHLFKREPAPPCPFCSQLTLSVLHLLEHCPALSQIRGQILHKWATPSLIMDSSDSIQALFAFLHTTKLFHRI